MADDGMEMMKYKLLSTIRLGGVIVVGLVLLYFVVPPLMSVVFKAVRDFIVALLKVVFGINIF